MGICPSGWTWNYDAENRKALPEGFMVPEAPRVAPDEITREVMTLVRKHFGDHFWEPGLIWLGGDTPGGIGDAGAIHRLGSP